MTEEENAAYDDLVDEVDKLNDRVRDLLAENRRVQLVADMAEEELVFQRDINQQIGKENEQLKAEIAAIRETAQEAAKELGYLASALDIDMPSDSGYVDVLQEMIRKLLEK